MNEVALATQETYTTIMSKEIIPFHGFDKIQIGMTQEQVKEILGPPASEETEVIDDLKEIIYDYDDQGLSLSFSSDIEYKLESISFTSPEFTYKGYAFPGMTEEEFLKVFEEDEELPELELRDDEEEHGFKEYFSDEAGIYFLMVDGRIDSLSIIPDYGF